MKAVALTILAVVFAIGGSHSGSVLSVRQARDAAKAKDERSMTISGYYIYHFEGDQLQEKPGEQTMNGIALIFGPAYREKRKDEGSTKSLGGRFDQKFVHIGGTLKRGPFMGSVGMLSDVVFLEVEEIKEANHTAEPSSPSLAGSP